MNVNRAFRCLSRRSGFRSTKQSRRHLATVQDVNVRPIAGSLGAEILGVDLRNLDSSTTSHIRDIWLKHKVVFFRDQQLKADEYLEFASKLGQPSPYPFVPGIEGYPEITHVLKREHEKNNFGGIWHSDTVYLEKPPMATMLLARELPPFGGDTLFANQVAAYEALSDGLKATLETLTCVHTSAKADVSKTREDRVADGGGKKEDLVSYHPAIRTHPETGKKVLYLNVAHTERFDGWTEAESLPLLQYLHAHQIKPEFTCRFKWDVGSLALWDNRQVLHNPINDYHGYRRSMHRITLAGEKPA
jgi:taurine dioxygenase